ncbi:MAG TPA: rhodanese-like domain-containing protein [Acidimicrobiia bacterium]|nr:rhodanese-like domain-containing protein [Acidimicrobiia bacterium]
MRVIPVPTPSLGDLTYLVTHGGHAVLVDPQRDVARFLDVARDEGVTLTHVLETHLHNDYISGGREAARRSGADLILPAAAGAAFPYVPAFHGEEFDVGAGLVIRPLHTPGHTPEHTSYVFVLDGEPVAAFSGGSLLVGAAGRSDLLGPERAHQLAVLQWGSIQRLASLPDTVGLFPTHGHGSFCSASTAGRSSSTIGEERATSPVLAYDDGGQFAAQHIADPPPIPRHYGYMSRINLLGPPPLPEPDLRELDPAEVERHSAAGTAHVVDVRLVQDFAAGHIPGSLGVQLDAQLGTWAGWLLPHDCPLVLVVGDGQDPSAAVAELGRVGFDHIVGILRGVEAWSASGRPLRSFRTVDIGAFADAVVGGNAILDVRSPAEWANGTVPRSVLRHLPDVPAGLPELAGLSPASEVWIGCGTGRRAAVAAGLLETHDLCPVVLEGAGMGDVLAELRKREAVGV